MKTKSIAGRLDKVKRKGALKQGSLLFAFVALILGITLIISSYAAPDEQYTLTGDSVQWENEYGGAKVTPHTMPSQNGEWEIELTSLMSSKDITCAFIAPEDAFEFNKVEYYADVQRLVPSEDYKQYWDNGTSSFKISADKQPNGSFHYETVQDWIDIKDKFSKASCLNGKTCYEVSMADWTQGSLKKIRAQADIAPDSNEQVQETPWFSRITHKRSNLKFDFACKKASDSWESAYSSGLLFLVDPWAVWN